MSSVTDCVLLMSHITCDHVFKLPSPQLLPVLRHTSMDRQS